MKQAVKLLEQTFKSSIGITEQWAIFARTFKREIKEELRKIGVQEFTFRRGHFECSGFFQMPDGQVWYFRLGDVRGPLSWRMNLLVRTAKDFKDFTGGVNCSLPIRERMFEGFPGNLR